MSTRLVVIGVGLMISLPLTWFAGEQHRENCIRQGRAGCSVLPWVAGSYPKPCSGLNEVDTIRCQVERRALLKEAW